MPLVSVIIINYNGRKYLSGCLDSLNRGTFRDFELIIVDNGSSDGSLELIKEKFPEVKLLELGENLGLSIASNRGRFMARGKYLFFFNNDTIADKDMLAELVRVAESDPDLGICGCKTLTYDGKRQINCGVDMDIFGYPYGKGLVFYVDAAIFIQAKVFDKINGFDRKLFLYCEDRDLCWRVWLCGYKVVAVKTAVFRHDSFCLLGKDEFSTNVKRRFMNEAFTIRMLIKNYSFFMLVFILPLYFLINLAEIILYLIKGKVGFLRKTYFAAYAWNFRNLGDSLKARKIVQAQRKISDIEIIKNMGKLSGKLLLFKRVGLPKVTTG